MRRHNVDRMRGWHRTEAVLELVNSERCENKIFALPNDNVNQVLVLVL
jgi:hypothetical protein